LFTESLSNASREGFDGFRFALALDVCDGMFGRDDELACDIHPFAIPGQEFHPNLISTPDWDLANEVELGSAKEDVASLVEEGREHGDCELEPSAIESLGV